MEIKLNSNPNITVSLNNTQLGTIINVRDSNNPSNITILQLMRSQPNKSGNKFYYSSALLRLDPINSTDIQFSQFYSLFEDEELKKRFKYNPDKGFLEFQIYNEPHQIINEELLNTIGEKLINQLTN